MFNDIKMNKKSVAEFGHSDSLKICVDPKNITLTLAFKYISPNWHGILS